MKHVRYKKRKTLSRRCKCSETSHPATHLGHSERLLQVGVAPDGLHHPFATEAHILQHEIEHHVDAVQRVHAVVGVVELLQLQATATLLLDRRHTRRSALLR